MTHHHPPRSSPHLHTHCAYELAASFPQVQTTLSRDTCLHNISDTENARQRTQTAIALQVTTPHHTFQYPAGAAIISQTTNHTFQSPVGVAIISQHKMPPRLLLQLRPRSQQIRLLGALLTGPSTLSGRRTILALSRRGPRDGIQLQLSAIARRR